MTEFSLGDKVELIEDYMSFKKGTRGTLVDAADDLSDPHTLIQVRTEGRSESERPDLDAYLKRFKKVEEPEPLAKRYKVLPHESQGSAGGPLEGEGDSFTVDHIGEVLSVAEDFVPGEVDWVFNGRPSVYLEIVDASNVTFPLDILEPVVEAEATAEETKPERERVPVVHMSELQVGDVVETAYDRNTLHAYVTRAVEPEVVEPEVVEPEVVEPGTRGTALVDGERIPGMIDEDGDFNFLTYDSYDAEVTTDYTSHFEDFEPED